MVSHFRKVWFAGTAISLNDFNERHNFDFEQPESDVELDDLLGLCEYAFNFAYALAEAGVPNCSSCLTVIEHIFGEIEPKRKELEKLSKTLSSDLFSIANNFNLRHNNIDPSNPGKYRRA